MSQSKSRTHFVVTGHIDHGKSTFIGRLLLEVGAIPTDRFENLKSSVKSADQRMEYSHLTDALADEKTKGITIGVSQTVFNYKQNEFVFLDAPGHHEFLQNMITGASKADLAFLIVDAAEGIKESTLRHLHMLSFLKIPRLAVLINKMDLVGYTEARFNELHTQLQQYLSELNLKASYSIPISAYLGENLIQTSKNMSWYAGPIAVDVLTEADSSQSKSNSDQEFCFVIHDCYNNGIVGELIAGQHSENAEYHVHQSGQNIKLKADPKNFQGERFQSYILNSPSDIKRGHIIISSPSSIANSNELHTSVVWFSSQSIKCGETVTLRLAKQEVCAKIVEVQSLIDSSSLNPLPTNTEIKKGSVFNCKISLENKISYAHFDHQPLLGRFVLLHNGQISGAGKINTPKP